MKFIHVADIHASRERLPQTLSILKTLTERTKRGDIDFIIFAGDFWDSTITATKGSGFSDIITAIRGLEKSTNLYFIYGTPIHEPSGSLDAFASSKTTVINKMTYINNKNCHIICIPEPRRNEYGANSIEQKNNLINETIKNWINDIAELHEKTKEYLPILGTYEYDKPSIVVYHGEVKGVVYQNGVSASSPTAISKELLQSLKADYYALGHIHLPQEVFENAWYPGSACPKNFGEIHDGHYNLVTVENGKTDIEQVSFGLPTYQTFNMFFGDFLKTESDFSNKHIRLQFDCTKEERKNINIKELSDSIKEHTHALSVKLEPNVIEGETIQTSEVSKRKSIVEKMTAYAKEKGFKIPKYAKDILEDIQNGTLAKLAYPQHSFELLSLSLRGAVGIRDGQHKEDFELDFEHFEDGVVCLAGPTGHGKSTLLENCHPYPCLLTREGTLKDHFYLKDSHRILVYEDENGLFYKISMLIDGKTATGKVNYYVETSKDRETWKSVPDVDGSLETYKKWVNNTFGNIDVFLRTAFFAKERTKEATDISDTTKSERMELLSKLAGTEHLKNVSSIAKDLRKEVEKSADKIEDEINSYSHYEDSIKENKKDIAKWKCELKNQEKIVTDLENKVTELQKKDAEYQKVKAVAEANTALYEQYEKEFNEKSKRLADLEECTNHKDIYNNIAECNAKLRNNAPRIDELNKFLSEKRKVQNELDDKLYEYRKSYSVKLTLQRSYENKISELKSQIVNIDVVCPTCGAPLSEHKKTELQNHVKGKQEELDKLTKELEIHNVYVKDVKDNIDFAENGISELKKEINKAEKELEELEDTCDKNAAYIQKYNQLYVEYTYDEVIAEVKNLRTDVKELKSKMDSISDSKDVKDVSKELKDTEDELKREQNRLTELKASVKAAEKENDKYAKALESVADKKAELLDLKDKITAYNFIEDAFSNNGIPAIELRESAPEIADITNKILADSYGNKFEIRFGPTSDIKTKRKVNEDFNIIVTDTENFDEKTIDLVSSGERIWIKQALFYAFSIVQMNRTGFNFRTRFIDESDGSLDGSLRPRYLKMVEAAHHISNSRITMLITHSQEIKDIVQQLIEI